MVFSAQTSLFKIFFLVLKFKCAVKPFKECRGVIDKDFCIDISVMNYRRYSDLSIARLNFSFQVFLNGSYGH
jgi:hypothetical protein